jgi:hypothetical protein
MVVLGMIVSYWTTNDSLQAVSGNKASAARDMAVYFEVSMNRADDLTYLHIMYSNPYPGVQLPENETIEATVDGFFYETEHAGNWLGALMDLEGVSYGSSIYNASMLLEFRVNGWENLSDGSTPAQAVMGHLLDEAAAAGNYTRSITAFEALHNATYLGFAALGNDVAVWSAEPSNSTTINRIGTEVDQLTSALIQWSDSYR